jgi:hypothetical protein
MTVVATDQAMVGMIMVTATSTLRNTDMEDMDMDMDMDITIIAEGAARAIPVVAAAKEAMEVTRRSIIINIIRDVGSCDEW